MTAVKAIYSASTVDSAMSDCLHADHVTGDDDDDDIL
jgi:hypothetical protein